MPHSSRESQPFSGGKNANLTERSAKMPCGKLAPIEGGLVATGTVTIDTGSGSSPLMYSSVSSKSDSCSSQRSPSHGRRPQLTSVVPLLSKASVSSCNHPPLPTALGAIEGVRDQSLSPLQSSPQAAINGRHTFCRTNLEHVFEGREDCDTKQELNAELMRKASLEAGCDLGSRNSLGGHVPLSLIWTSFSVRAGGTHALHHPRLSTQSRLLRNGTKETPQTGLMKPDEGRDSEFSDAQQQQRSSLENRRPDCGRLGVAGFSRASILDAAPVCASGAVSELERVSICDPQEHGTPQTRSTERKLRGSLGHLGKAGDVATSLTAARKSSSTLSRSLSSLHTMSWNKKRLHTSASANAILSEMSPTNGVRRLRNNPPTQSHSRSYVVKGTSRVSNKSAVSDCSNSRSNSLSLPSSPFQPVNESSDGCTSEPCCNNHGVIATEYKTSGGNVQKIVREVAYNNFFTDEDIPFVSTRSFRRRSLSPR